MTIARVHERRLLRTKVSLLIVTLFVLVIAIASLRARAWLGITVVFCIAVGLNFATMIVIATDLHERIRLSALAYTIGGWAWLLMITFIPEIDLFFESHLITPRILKWLVPGPNPDPMKPDRAIILSHVLAHSLLSITLGSFGAMLAWKLGQRMFDPDPQITPTTG